MAAWPKSSLQSPSSKAGQQCHRKHLRCAMNDVSDQVVPQPATTASETHEGLEQKGPALQQTSKGDQARVQWRAPLRCGGRPLHNGLGLLPRSRHKAPTALSHHPCQAIGQPLVPWTCGPASWQGQGCRCGFLTLGKKGPCRPHCFDSNIAEKRNQVIMA